MCSTPTGPLPQGTLSLGGSFSLSGFPGGGGFHPRRESSGPTLRRKPGASILTNETTPIDDLVKPGDECRCEFQPYDEPDPDGESCHYKRKCKRCGFVWWGLHCPHDGYQNPCGKCGQRPETINESM